MAESRAKSYFCFKCPRCGSIRAKEFRTINPNKWRYVCFKCFKTIQVKSKKSAGLNSDYFGPLSRTDAIRVCVEWKKEKGKGEKSEFHSYKIRED